MKSKSSVEKHRGLVFFLDFIHEQEVLLIVCKEYTCLDREFRSGMRNRRRYYGGKES